MRCPRDRCHKPELAGDRGKRKVREDLYFCLAVVVVKTPPLRDRGDDIATVAKAFLQTDPRGGFAHLRAPRPSTVQAQRQGDVLRDGE